MYKKAAVDNLSNVYFKDSPPKRGNFKSREEGVEFSLKQASCSAVGVQRFSLQSCPVGWHVKAPAERAIVSRMCKSFMERYELLSGHNTGFCVTAKARVTFQAGKKKIL